jgi:hypothetical protein
MKARARFRMAPAALGALALALATLAGCGDDDSPADPSPDRTIEFPGDAATLQEAIDMASAGDTVRVGAGTHDIDSTLVFGASRAGVTLAGRAEGDAEKALAPRPILNFTRPPLGDGIVVLANVANVTIRGLELRGNLRVGVGLLGPGARLTDCVVQRADPYSVSCTQANSNGRIDGNLLLYPTRFGVYAILGAHPTIVGNTIVGSNDCGIYTDSEPVCERNIVVLSRNWGIFCAAQPPPALHCNDVFGSGLAPYGNCEPGDGDIERDPLFCDSTDFMLHADSPCAPDSSCGQIGASGVGCGARGGVAARS